MKNLATKALPLSDDNCRGIPKREITSLKNIRAVVSASKLGTGAKIGHPKKLSTQQRIATDPQSPYDIDLYGQSPMYGTDPLLLVMGLMVESYDYNLVSLVNRYRKFDKNP